jgi:mannosyl-3-phosphoglycerate phosphatase
MKKAAGMPDSPHYIVFTDLDATLLDHESYSHAPAQPSIDLLIDRDIPLVFVTSKTRPEVEKLQEKMGLCSPFIVENGGAIFIPRCCSRLFKADHDAEYEIITLGEAYDACTDLLERLKTQFGLRGFSHMHHEEVSERTGLEPEGAAMAKTRHCSEPFVMEDESRLAELEAIVSAEGFTVTKGGRFYHLIGKNQSKGVAVKALLERAEAEMGVHFRSIALGDSENDFTMLQSVDIPVLIPRHDGQYANINLPGMIKAPYPGPKGWNTVLQELLGAG